MDAEELSFRRNSDLYERKIRLKASAPKVDKHVVDKQNAENILQQFANIKGKAYGSEIALFNSFNSFFEDSGFLTPKQMSVAKHLCDKIKLRVERN